MNKAVLSLALLLLTAACLPLTPAPPAPTVVSNIDNAGTAEAMLRTAIAQTLAVLPTNTPLPPVNTATLPATSTSELLPSLTAGHRPDCHPGSDRHGSACLHRNV